jgi:hypothetical protein
MPRLKRGMTSWEYDTAVPRRGCTRVVVRTTLGKTEGAGKAGCSPHPRPLCIGRKHRVVTTGVAEITRPSLRDGFNGFLRALPGDRALLPPSFLRSLLLKNLAPASGHQDHTAPPSASRVARLAPLPASTASRPAFVTTRTPLLPRRDARKMLLIWGIEQYRPPAAQWHDGQFAHDAYARSARRAVSAMCCFASGAHGAATSSLRGAQRRSNPSFGKESFRGEMDCFAEPVIGRAFARPVGSQ